MLYPVGIAVYVIGEKRKRVQTNEASVEHRRGDDLEGKLIPVLNFNTLVKICQYFKWGFL